MSMYKREMMASEMTRVISMALRKMKDPRLEGIVSVTRIELSKDFRYAKVYLSIFEKDELKSEELFHVLEKAKGYFKTEVAKQIRTFKAPQLTLIHDKGIEKAFELDKIFKKIENEKRNSKS